MFENLMSNPYAWTFLAIITITSFVYAIICQQKNKEKKEFSFSRQSNILISEKKSIFSKLSITYDNKPIDDLCVSQYAIWNSGNRTLNASDIVDSKELTISVSEGNTILDVEIIANTETTNNFSVEKNDENRVIVRFDYADKKDGIVIQIIHTGTTKDLSIDCKIKGGLPIRDVNNETIFQNYFYRTFKKVNPKALVFSAIFESSILIIFTLTSFISIFNAEFRDTIFLFKGTDYYQNGVPQYISIGITIMLTLLTASLILVLIPRIKKEYKIGIPKKLKSRSGFSE